MLKENYVHRSISSAYFEAPIWTILSIFEAEPNFTDAYKKMKFGMMMMIIIFFFMEWLTDKSVSTDLKKKKFWTRL